MSYTTQYILAVIVGLLVVGLGVIQAATPADYGMSAIQFKWLGVFSAMLGVLAGALPSWRKPPSG